MTVLRKKKRKLRTKINKTSVPITNPKAKWVTYFSFCFYCIYQMLRSKAVVLNFSGFLYPLHIFDSEDPPPDLQIGVQLDRNCILNYKMAFINSMFCFHRPLAVTPRTTRVRGPLVENHWSKAWIKPMFFHIWTEFDCYIPPVLTDSQSILCRCHIWPWCLAQV